MKTHIYFAILLFLASSCCKNLDTILEKEDLLNNLHLNVNLVQTNYEDNNTKSELQWPNGAKLYIHFSNEESTQTYPATITYNSSINTWSLSAIQGELVIGDSAKCHVIYLPNIKGEEIMELDMSDPIYEDSQAEYYIEGNTLTITAKLTPKTGRIRFAGKAGTKFKLYGISHYTTYNTHHNFWGSSSDEIELEVQANGYTPYIHAFFPNDAKKIEITNSNDKIFIFKCSEQHLEPGISGFFNIPTETNLGNWRMYDNIIEFQIPESNESFRMIFVQWIYGSYFMAETETTQELWETITNNNPSDYKSETPGMPVENFNKENLSEFLSLLQDKTSYPFTIPNIEQWLHAAKGGNKSKGYRFSGSDDLEEVAWWYFNSNNTTHPVKGKKANELGLYDMTGNVSESCLDNNTLIIYGLGGKYSEGDQYRLMNLKQLGRNDYVGDHAVGFRLCLNL